MQPYKFRYEVDMGETRKDRQERPLVFVHSRQRAGLRISDSAFISNQWRSLTERIKSIPFVHILRFAQQVLAFIVSNFVIGLIFGRKRVVQQRKRNDVSSQSIVLKQMQEKESIAIAELKDQFLNMASHELKTPMTTIVGHVQLVLRRLARLPEISSELAVIRTALERIDGQTRRLNVLVDQLLDLNNLREGRVEIERKPCNLANICQNVVEGQEFLSGRTIDFATTSDSIVVKGDASRLMQVFENLIDNAMKYSTEESHVKVQLSTSENVALVQIEDSGKGISPDEQTHLFEPFYRSPSVQSSSISGLGLGLSICKDIVEQHSGYMWCESQRGKGSTFFVALPL